MHVLIIILINVIIIVVVVVVVVVVAAAAAAAAAAVAVFVLASVSVNSRFYGDYLLSPGTNFTEDEFLEMWQKVGFILSLGQNVI